MGPPVGSGLKWFAAPSCVEWDRSGPSTVPSGRSIRPERYAREKTCHKPIVANKSKWRLFDGEHTHTRARGWPLNAAARAGRHEHKRLSLTHTHSMLSAAPSSAAAAAEELLFFCF